MQISIPVRRTIEWVEGNWGEQRDRFVLVSEGRAHFSLSCESFRLGKKRKIWTDLQWFLRWRFLWRCSQRDRNGARETEIHWKRELNERVIQLEHKQESGKRKKDEINSWWDQTSNKGAIVLECEAYMEVSSQGKGNSRIDGFHGRSCRHSSILSLGYQSPSTTDKNHATVTRTLARKKQSANLSERNGNNDRKNGKKRRSDRSIRLPTHSK